MAPETLSIIPYPHPTLRYKSKPLVRVDEELRKIIRQMFDLMYEAKGVGLAANQVGLPLRFFIVNELADPLKGQERVFINPVLSLPKGSDKAEEGCLSLPALYADVIRPKTVRVNAYDITGEEINFEASGLLSRIVQHETDHLDGVLFIDRLADAERAKIENEIHELEIVFQSRRDAGGIPSDITIAIGRQESENRYCK
jgi:peptide deformylase